jgi:hypothetical protein
MWFASPTRSYFLAAWRGGFAGFSKFYTMEEEMTGHAQSKIAPAKILNPMAEPSAPSAHKKMASTRELPPFIAYIGANLLCAAELCAENAHAKTVMERAASYAAAVTQ